MSYNTMLADFTTILNRDDCSPAQAAVFLTQGVQRVQRDCRLPSMEREQIITIGDAGADFVLVPKDLVQPIDIIWTSTGRSTEPKALKKLPYRDLIRKNGLDLPRWYARMQSQFWIKGSATPGEVIQIFYYGNFSNWATPDSDNELSASTPDLGVYAALSYAGDYFECSLAGQWEARYQTIKAEVIQMAEDLDAEGGEQVMQPVYHWD
jgi:hypothetical protein